MRNNLPIVVIVMAIAVGIVAVGAGISTVTGTAPITITGSGDTAVVSLGACANGEALVYNTVTSTWECGSSGHTIQDEAIDLTDRDSLNFTGAGVSCVDNAGGNRTDCTITGVAGSGVQLDLGNDDVIESTGITEINVTGDTNSIFTETPADQILVDVGNAWPIADDTVCTDCLTATEITDIYVLTAGDDMTGNLLLDNQSELRLGEPDGAGTEFIIVEAPATLSANRTCTLEDDATPFDPCVSGGASDSVTVNGTAVDTTANFLDGDIDFTHVDGGAGGPDDVTATVACTNCVALGAETTNNYVATIVDSGAGTITVVGSGSESAAITLLVISNAGTDITTDLEEETHASEHAVGAGDEVGFYGLVDDEGTPLTARRTLNFIGAGVSCVDDGGGAETDCTIAGGSGGEDLQETYDLEASPALITLSDALGGIEIEGDAEVTDASLEIRDSTANKIGILIDNDDEAGNENSPILRLANSTVGAGDTQFSIVVTTSDELEIRGDDDASDITIEADGDLNLAANIVCSDCVGDSDVSNTITVGNAGTVDPDAISCDVADDNLISEDCFGDVLDAGEIEDIYVFNSGDAMAGDLDYNDGVTDSPKAIFTPQTGTPWDIYTEDGTDDLQIEVTTAVTENFELINTGAGTVTIQVDSLATGGAAECLESDTNGVISVTGAVCGSGATAVTSGSVLVDNSIVRGDGGSRGVQDSGILIDDSDNLTGVNSLTYTAATELTLDNPAGEITVTNFYHTVDTFSDAASDQLDGINGGTEAMIIVLRPENDARTIIIAHNQNPGATNNILLHNNLNVQLNNEDHSITLIYDSGLDTNGAWVMLSSFNNATVHVGSANVNQSTLAVDAVGTNALDDTADTPVAGDFVAVAAGATDFEYLTSNAGTDITADLEEETHASEHAIGAGDEVAFYGLIDDEGTPLTARRTLNFIGAGISCVDDGGGAETDCTVAGGAGGEDLQGTYDLEVSPALITLADALGGIVFEGDAEVTDATLTIRDSTAAKIGILIDNDDEASNENSPILRIVNSTSGAGDTQFSLVVTTSDELEFQGDDNAFDIRIQSDGDLQLAADLICTSCIDSTDIGIDVVAAVDIAVDAINTSELDDAGDTPAAGEFVVIATATSDFEYIASNAGTDITADLEEEDHAGEHAIGGGDEVAFYGLIDDEGTPLTARRTLNFTGAGITCVDDGAGAETDCDVTSGSGDITDVGPGCSTGACFTDGLITSGVNVLIWEGTGDDANEFIIAAPANPVVDQTFTFPDDNIAADDLLIGTGAGTFKYAAVPDCNTNNRDRVQYDVGANVFSCDSDVFVIGTDTDAETGDIEAVGPGCSAGGCFLDGTATVGTLLLVWEGTSIDGNEFTIAVPANPSVDQVFTFPDDQIVDDDLLVGNGAGTFEYRALPDSDGATQKLQYDQATNTFSAGTDDDVPESGDFGAGADLETTGAISANAVTSAKILDDGVNTADLDDGGDTPSAGECLVVATATSDIEYITCPGGGSAITFDIGDDGGDDSTDVNEIATTGDTNTIFTEPSPDKILIAVGNNWPTSDTADALSANPSDCAAGTKADSIVANGDLTCTSVDSADIALNTIVAVDIAIDAINTSELDDGGDTPSAGECLVVATAVSDIEYVSCAAGGDITTVGVYTGPTAFLDGVVTSGTEILVWEGTGDDTNELTISGPANPAVDQTFTFPDDNIADDDLLVGSGAGTFGYVTIVDCNGANINRQQYDTATNTWGCDTDPVAAGEYASASIDGDDVATSLAGRSLTLTPASPDTLDLDPEIYTEVKGFVLLDPVDGDDIETIWRSSSFAVTIVGIYCETDAGTVTMDLEIDDGSVAAVNGSVITCTTSGVEDVSFAGDFTMGVDDRLDLEITTVTTATRLSVMFEFEKDD